MTEFYFYGLIFHFIGDYITQSDWMASEKTKSWTPAIIHSLVYGAPFLLLTGYIEGLLLIVCSHALIDHYRLARFVVYAKNFLAPKRYWYKWKDCNVTGYHESRPQWLSVWLMIIADNIIHISLNTLAIYLSWDGLL